MPYSYLVVGDVHGCVDELEDLIRVVRDPERQLVLVGDLVGKGPASHDVIAYVQERNGRSVLGNHDDHAIQAHRPRDGRQRLSSTRPLHIVQRNDGLDTADIDYLESLPLWIQLEDAEVIVVHAGLIPGVALTRQSRKDLLTLRSFRPDGTSSTRVEGTPWAARWKGPEHVLFGHDAVRGLQQHPYATGLDTGCVYGKGLTGLLVPEHELVSVPARRTYREVNP